MPKNYKYYNPLKFNVNAYSPALWLDASDASTLVMDGARTFTSATPSYLSCVSNSTLQTGNVDWWFSIWTYATGTGGGADGRLVCKRSGNNCDFDISYGGAGDGVLLVMGTGATTESYDFGGYVANAWRHYFIYKSGATVNCITNGSAGTPQNVTITPAVSTADFAVGNYSANLVSRGFDGRMDSIAFGKPTLGWLASNATALASYLYNGGSGRRSSDFMASSYYTGGNPSGAVSWWDMDARSGTETDRIGSNNLTDNGGVGYAAGVASGLVQYTGDPVKQWSDKSGNARHVTAVSDAARPAYTTGRQNGLPMLVHDGVDDVLAINSATWLKDASEVVVMGVVKPVAAAAADTDTQGALAFLDNNGAGSQFWYGPHGASSANFAGEKIGALHTSASGLARMAVGSAYSRSANTAEVWEGVYGASGTRLFVNGTEYTIDLLSNALVTNPSGPVNVTISSPRLSLGTYHGGVGFVIGELLIFTSSKDAAQRANLRRYLGNKWGITVA